MWYVLRHSTDPESFVVVYLRTTGSSNVHDHIFPRLFLFDPPLTVDHCDCTHSISTGLHKDIEMYNKRYKSLDMCYSHPSIKFIDVFIGKNSYKLKENRLKSWNFWFFTLDEHLQVYHDPSCDVQYVSRSMKNPKDYMGKLWTFNGGGTYRKNRGSCYMGSTV